MHTALASVVLATLAVAQQPEPAVSKDAISVHRVERGTMPVREIAAGSIVSIKPPRAILALSRRQSRLVRVGQSCSVQIVPPSVLAATVASVNTTGSGPNATAQVEISGAIPQGTSIGKKVGALIDVGVAQDVLFFARPADARPNTTATVFVLEPDGEHAKRVPVEYGRQSGPLIEILKGLGEGDRVIVTDMSAFAGHDRVRLK